ncbi:hypothetical protein HDZ31DRAFT_40678, partial [Schizophyllum fasciatum]
CASAAEALSWAGQLRRKGKGTYGYYIQNMLPDELDDDDEATQALNEAMCNPVPDPGLRTLVIGGNNTDPLSQVEVANYLTAVRPGNLESAKIFRPGRSSAYFEAPLYGFLMHPGRTGALKQLTLQWHCCLQAAFTAYLESDASSSLRTLRLQTNADIRCRIADALVSGHCFPSLRRLTLMNIQGLTAPMLLGRLRTRHMKGFKRRLRVEMTGVVSDGVQEAAQRLNISMISVSDDCLEEPVPAELLNDGESLN